MQLEIAQIGAFTITAVILGHAVDTRFRLSAMDVSCSRAVITVRQNLAAVVRVTCSQHLRPRNWLMYKARKICSNVSHGIDAGETGCL